jgi:hypothetical protein
MIFQPATICQTSCSLSNKVPSVKCLTTQDVRQIGGQSAIHPEFGEEVGVLLEAQSASSNTPNPLAPELSYPQLPFLLQGGVPQVRQAGRPFLGKIARMLLTDEVPFMRIRIHALLFLIFLAVITACSSDSAEPAAAIESYNHALVEEKNDQLTTLSCSDWEADAQNELASFAAVTVSLEDMTCSETSKDGDTALVSCTGKIIANYGNEVLEINLADRLYQVVLEGGEWRMCGYR